MDQQVTVLAAPADAQQAVMPETMSMTAIPLVSVVVPAYNAESTIASCIESLLAQDYPQERLEIIVVDNNSRDDTAGIVAAYPVTLLSEVDKQSAYATRNRGIRHASGDIVAFTDSDCIAEQTWLRNLVRHWRNDAIGCFSGLVKPYQQESTVALLLGRYQADRFHGQKKTEWPYAIGGNCAYKRSVLDEIGLFDEDLRSGGDVELSWRMQKKSSKRIQFVEDAVVYHRYPERVRDVLKTTHFRGYGQGILNEGYGYKGTVIIIRLGEFQNSASTQLLLLAPVRCQSLAQTL
jgi:glycosyltransferase involved in cell wall biosynthesis